MRRARRRRSIPQVRVLSFWNGDQPLVVLSYYATHPQSYYGQGGVSYDFVGMARAQRESALPGVPHIHFNGAAGNVAAGKYNDGSPANRADAGRAAGRRHERGLDRHAAHAARLGSDVGWRTRDVKLPLSPHLADETPLVQLLDNAGGHAVAIACGRPPTWPGPAGCKRAGRSS